MRFLESKGLRTAFIVGAAGGALLTVLGWFVTDVFLLSRPDPATYQAVFLANDQVYFGKLRGLWGASPTLDDVFYLQINQPLQQGAKESSASSSGQPTAPATPKFTLLRLGQSEIHGPESSLHLLKSQVLFWENLRRDSQVVRAIQEFKKQNPR